MLSLSLLNCLYTIPYTIQMTDAQMLLIKHITYYIYITSFPNYQSVFLKSVRIFPASNKSILSTSTKNTRRMAGPRLTGRPVSPCTRGGATIHSRPRVHHMAARRCARLRRGQQALARDEPRRRSAHRGLTSTTCALLRGGSARARGPHSCGAGGTQTR